MSYGPFACQNSQPRREIRFSLIITRSVLTHQRKKPVQNIYISCTSSPRHICLERRAIMLETVRKFPSSQWYYTHLRKMPSLQWEKPSFSWQRPSLVYRFRLCLSNMLRFPSWSHPKISLRVLWGCCPQQTSEVPWWQWLPRHHTALGKGSVPISSPSTDGVSKAFASCCGLGALQSGCKQSKEGTGSAPLLPWPCSRDIQGTGQRGACSTSRAASSQQAGLQQAGGLHRFVHPKNHPAAPTQPLCSTPAQLKWKWGGILPAGKRGARVCWIATSSCCSLPATAWRHVPGWKFSTCLLQS